MADPLRCCVVAMHCFQGVCRCHILTTLQRETMLKSAAVISWLLLSAFLSASASPLIPTESDDSSTSEVATVSSIALDADATANYTLVDFDMSNYANGRSPHPTTHNHLHPSTIICILGPTFISKFSIPNYMFQTLKPSTQLETLKHPTCLS